MNITPLNDRVLIRRITQSDRTSGGIYIPEAAKEKPIEAIVLASATPAVREGDRVLVSKHVGTDVSIDGEALVLVKGEDLLAVVREAPAAPAEVSGARGQG